MTVYNRAVAKGIPIRPEGKETEEAATAFLDTGGLDGEDLEHSKSEPRRVRLAKSGLGRVLPIAYTAYTIRSENHEEVTRIISARRASRKERKRYEAKEN